MNGVQSIESLAAGDGRHNLLRTLGPTLLILMGYIDLGKWLATVDAGSRFGYDLVLLVVLFNFSAILYQYLSVCIGVVTEEPCRDCEAELLGSLRFCIMKLLKLEGSGWLFSQNGGYDENLVDQISEAERVSQEKASDDRGANAVYRVPNCGDDCVWRASLVVSFGVWCIHRVLDLSLVESRPELWGKYTYVLSRLQGIIEPAFSKPRKPLTGCACLTNAGAVGKPIPSSFTTSAGILEVIKGVEQAVSGRKGRSGTAAGDVAFPKGKENLASVLKRYKRRLSSKTPAGR